VASIKTYFSQFYPDVSRFRSGFLVGARGDEES
jgi:hypothetical protein